MRWIVQHPGSKGKIAILTRSNDTKYLRQDVDVFSGWALADVEVAALDQLNCTTNPEICGERYGRMTWGCTE